MFKRSLIAVIILATLLTACSVPVVTTGNTIRGSGKYATRDYQLDGFTGISTCCGFKVTVTGGDTFNVSVTADDNVLDFVTVRKEGETLRIELDTSKVTSFSTTRLEAAVTLPTLQAVTRDGGAQLDLAQPAPKGVNLTVNANGGSRATLSAIAVQKASVTLGGGSHATINVTGSLDYDLSGGSQLQYTGKPTLGSTKTSGGANVSQY